MMMDWQPIETAPAGGRFLVYALGEGRVPEWLVVLVDCRDGLLSIDGAEYACWSITRATHWMPLPAPPTA